MPLIEYPDVVQGSDEWMEQRRGMVTASVVKQLVTPTLKVAANMDSRSLTAELVAQRITGYTEPEYIGSDMLRGIEDEPRARDLYAEESPYTVTTLGFVVRDDWGFQIGYSPDGLVGDLGLLEVKSRNQKLHLQTILSGEVPGGFMAQIQTGLLVSGREWCDFVSYSGGMPLFVKRVYPSATWQMAILEAVGAFEKAATEMVTEYRSAVVGMPTTERVIEMEMI
jgi:hypothetical protein